MNHDDYTRSELAEILIDLNLIDEGDEAELTYYDLRLSLIHI